MTYEELQTARAELELPEQVTLKKLRQRHRELVRRYHPDRGAAGNNERIRRINAAYKLLNQYIADYRFDFSRETFRQQYPGERLREQFYDIDLWGGRG